jgi:hypothetical protein
MVNAGSNYRAILLTHIAVLLLFDTKRTLHASGLHLAQDEQCPNSTNTIDTSYAVLVAVRGSISLKIKDIQMNRLP